MRICVGSFYFIWKNIHPAHLQSNSINQHYSLFSNSDAYLYASSSDTSNLFLLFSINLYYDIVFHYNNLYYIRFFTYLFVSFANLSFQHGEILVRIFPGVCYFTWKLEFKHFLDDCRSRKVNANMKANINQCYVNIWVKKSFNLNFFYHAVLHSLHSYKLFFS